MCTDERVCSLALTLCTGVGHIGARRLVAEMGSAVEVFRYRTELPDRLPEVSPAVVAALDNPAAFARAEQEIAFVEKNHLTCLTYHDEAYPSRLRECEDAPVALFFKGQVDLNRLRLVAMVGTRQATEYGKQFCADFVHDLAALCPDVVVVSGLAYGIDIMLIGQRCLRIFLQWQYWHMVWTVSIPLCIVKRLWICCSREDC